MIENFGDKINSSGLDKNPENINRNGRPVSIKAQLKDLLESEGNLTITANQVVQIKDSGDIVIKVPTQMQMAMKLSSWAMSKKGNDSLKALQMIMEQIDGKPNQNHQISGDPDNPLEIKTGFASEKQEEEFNEFLKKKYKFKE